MRLGIDWFSTLLFLAAYSFSQIRVVPPRAGYGALALASAIIAVYRYRMGAQGVNLIFVGLAAAMALYYGSRMLAGGRPRGPRSSSDDGV